MVAATETAKKDGKSKSQAQGTAKPEDKKQDTGKLAFGEKSRRLQELWKEKGDKATLKEVKEFYVTKYSDGEPTDQTVSAAKYKAFPDLVKAVRGKKAEGPTLENLQALIIVMTEKGVKAAELKEALEQVQENPFAVYEEAAGGRENLKQLLDRVAAIQQKV
jgi:hypothetical protein